MKRKETSDALRAAELMLKEALHYLDDSSEPCGSCGVKVYAAFDEHQMAEQLRGALGRCRRVRLWVEGKADAAEARPRRST